jgi:chromosome segregation ATPase
MSLIKHTCPSIDSELELIKSFFQEKLEEMLRELDEGVSHKKITNFANDYSNVLLKEFEFYFEEVRSTNVALRESAEIAISELKDQIDELQDDISNYENEATELERNVSELEEEIYESRKEISVLESTVDELELNVSELEGEVHELRYEISVLEEVKEEVEEEVSKA